MSRKVVLVAAIAALAACEAKKAPPAAAVDSGQSAAARQAASPNVAASSPDDAIALSPEDAKKAVVFIDGEPAVLLGDFVERLRQQSPYTLSKFSTLDKKLEFLDTMVRFELMAKEAKARGLDKDPDVQRTMKQAMIQKLIATVFEAKMKREEVTDEHAKKFFDENPKEYLQPEQVQASQILIRVAPNASAADKERLRAKAMQVLGEVKAQASNPLSFGELAKKSSDDLGTKMLGGDMRWFNRAEEGGPYPKAVSDAVFALKKPGDIADRPIDSPQGYHILKLTDRRAAAPRPFESVKMQIKNRLFRDRRTKAFDAFVAELREKSKVVVEKGPLDLVKMPNVAPTTRPPHPGGFGRPPFPGGIRATPVPSRPTSPPR